MVVHMEWCVSVPGEALGTLFLVEDRGNWHVVVEGMPGDRYRFELRVNESQGRWPLGRARSADALALERFEPRLYPWSCVDCRKLWPLASWRRREIHDECLEYRGEEWTCPKGHLKVM